MSALKESLLPLSQINCYIQVLKKAKFGSEGVHWKFITTTTTINAVHHQSCAQSGQVKAWSGFLYKKSLSRRH